MTSEFVVAGMKFVISDRGEFDEGPNCQSPRNPNSVGVSIYRGPSLGSVPDFELLKGGSLKPSEARTLASALMTAAQNAR